MDEQIVPSFNPLPAFPGADPKSLRRSKAINTKLATLAPKPALVSNSFSSIPLVPIARSLPQSSSSTNPAFASPAAEYPGKPRWQTPLRVGKWRENWQSARELGLPVCVRSTQAAAVATVVRTNIADAVVAYVGPHLPRQTVEKWLCLLFEYLELNADEQILVVCLLRTYVQQGGRFVGRGDWARPQRWECVVAVASYFAVLLSEEFPGRTAMDLRELLGPNFRFGCEQVSFLKVVDWRISISAQQFKEASDVCQAIYRGDQGAKQKMNDWFMIDQTAAERKLRNAEEAAAAAASRAPFMSEISQTPQLVGKKRSYANIMPADDSVVPRIVVPRLGTNHVHPVPATQPTFIPSIAHWVPQW